MRRHQAGDSSHRPAHRRRRAGLAVACAAIVTAVVGCTSTSPAHHAAPAPSPVQSLAVRSVPPPPRACAVSSTLVNSCRPWLGAAASGNPGAPNSKLGQFQYLERLIDHHLDVYRDYNPAPGTKPHSTLPLNSNELAALKLPGTYDDVNWKPAANWAEADGGDAAVNAEIKQVAGNIKAVAPHKIFLTVWWEPQQYVSGGSNCPGLHGSAGTPAQYKQMWRNVENIFRAQGVTNVVWTMDYMGSHPNEDCLVPQLWPGNSLVDWVLYDSYDHDIPQQGTNWSDTVGRFYHVLEQDSSPSVDFDAKPWGLGEFGTCRTPSVANSHQYFEQAKQSIDANAYPRLKMYLFFAVGQGHTSKGCLTDYDPNGQPDPTKNTEIRSFANSSLFNR
jgi:hypothetical protein